MTSTASLLTCIRLSNAVGSKSQAFLAPPTYLIEVHPVGDDVASGRYGRRRPLPEYFLKHVCGRVSQSNTISLAGGPCTERIDSPSQELSISFHTTISMLISYFPSSTIASGVSESTPLHSDCGSGSQRVSVRITKGITHHIDIQR